MEWSGMKLNGWLPALLKFHFNRRGGWLWVWAPVNSLHSHITPSHLISFIPSFSFINSTKEEKWAAFIKKAKATRQEGARRMKWNELWNSWNGIPPLQEGRQPITQQLKREDRSPPQEQSTFLLLLSKEMFDFPLACRLTSVRWCATPWNQLSPLPLFFISFQFIQKERGAQGEIDFTSFSFQLVGLFGLVLFLWRSHWRCHRP